MTIAIKPRSAIPYLVLGFVLNAAFQIGWDLEHGLDRVSDWVLTLGYAQLAAISKVSPGRLGVTSLRVGWLLAYLACGLLAFLLIENSRLRSWKSPLLRASLSWIVIGATGAAALWGLIAAGWISD